MKTAYIYASITILCWSFGSYIGRLLSLHSQFLLAAVTFAFTFLFFLVYDLSNARGREHYFSGFRWGYLFWGSLGYFAYTVPQIQSFRAFDSASETTLLVYTWPIFVVLFAWIVGKENAGTGQRFRESLGLLCGLLAVGLIATEGRLLQLQFSNLAGVLWGLLAGVSYGAFSYYSATVPKTNQTQFLLGGSFGSLVLVAPFGLAELAQPEITLDAAGIGVAAVAGILLNGMAYAAWTTALRETNRRGLPLARIVSLIFMLPLTSLAVIAVLLGERAPFQGYFLVSLVLIVVSFVLTNWKPAVETITSSQT
jgi:drug/metabolite transporter (DMT)-like permease